MGDVHKRQCGACLHRAVGEHFAHVLNAADARLACVGKATAAELERCGIEPDYIPHTQSAMGMLAGFPTGDRQQDEPDTVWVIEGQNARPTLREGLGALGFRVMRTVVYRMEPAAEADLAPGELGCDAAREALSREASAGQPVTDAVVATAPSLLQALAEGCRPTGSRRWWLLGRAPHLLRVLWGCRMWWRIPRLRRIWRPPCFRW